jgi:antitoxin component YwqK of YwqJK toxin-antitoxin module
MKIRQTFKLAVVIALSSETLFTTESSAKSPLKRESMVTTLTISTYRFSSDELPEGEYRILDNSEKHLRYVHRYSKGVKVGPQTEFWEDSDVPRTIAFLEASLKNPKNPITKWEIGFFENGRVESIVANGPGPNAQRYLEQNERKAIVETIKSLKESKKIVSDTWDSLLVSNAYKFNSKGLVTLTIESRNGLKHGKESHFDDSGKPVSLLNFQDGKQSVGESISDAKTGEKLVVTRGKDNEPTEKRTTDKEGRLIEVETFEKNKLVKLITYWQNGNPKTSETFEGSHWVKILHFDNGPMRKREKYGIAKPAKYQGEKDQLELDGLSEYWYPDGKLEYSGNYKKGKLEGLTIHNAQDSKARVEAEFVNDVLVHKKTFSESGKMISEERFNPDGSRIGKK